MPFVKNTAIKKAPVPFMPRRSLYKSLSVRRTARQIYPLTAF